MAGGGSKRPIVVYGAIAANAVVAIIKFVAAVVTGSSAMLAEAIHSVVDTANQCLLLLGIHMSRKPADDEHPYGHGKELYFWSLVVAIVIFGVGGGMSIFEGIAHVLERKHGMRDPVWAYAVLGAAFLFEGASFLIAAREFGRTMGDEGVFEELHQHKDPSVYTVLVEDGTALAGLVVAFLGVLLSHLLDAPALDGVASIVIGAMLAAVAVFLARESKGLLVGESADPEVVASIGEIARREPGVLRVGRPLTMHLGPDQVLLNLSIEFRKEVSAAELTATIDRIERAIRREHPTVVRMFVESEALKER